MYKLLIVDDEPLVQIGVKSMLKWEEYNIEVIGTAANGKQAIELMNKNMPDIVITDVKMPLMDGLQLVKYCMENFDSYQAFIILTSYEEFELAKEAIKYNVIDYLVKLELTAESLEESIKKSLIKVKKNKGDNSENVNIINNIYEKFFFRLLYNLFKDEDDMKSEIKDLKLELEGKILNTCFCEIYEENEEEIEEDIIRNKYMCTLNMLQEISGKYLKCFVIPLDLKRFSLICFYNESNPSDINNSLNISMNKICSTINKYFNVQIKVGIGNLYDDIKYIPISFQEARECFNSSEINSENIQFYCNVSKLNHKDKVFNISIFKDDLIKAFEEYDAHLLKNIFSKIINFFYENNTGYLQALDCSCNLLYLSLNLLPEGEKYINEIFSSDLDGYRSIYNKKNIDQIIQWLNYFCERLCEILEERRKTYKNHIVSQVKKYINTHLEEKLFLNDIADIYQISPSYLSAIFKRYCNIGFSEYINNAKVNKAKELLKENYKVYEVSDKMGFESAFYFSKVFKKVTGCSPKEYIQKQG